MTKDERLALWVARIKDYQASGERVATWCERHQVTQHQLWYWMRKVKQAEQPVQLADHPQWMALRLDETKTGGVQSLLVRVGTASIEVKAGFEPSLLADVVRT